MDSTRWRTLGVAFAVLALALGTTEALAQAKGKQKVPEAPLPPTLPGGKPSATDTSERFLQAPPGLKEGVAVAKAVPTVDFSYPPGQDYPGKPWSVWGDGLAANGKYYLSFGDHLALGGRSGDRSGNAFVFEYDPGSRAYRKLVDLQQLLKMPAGHYTPGKIHSRIDLGHDGWLYFSTHRGSTGVTKDDRYHFKGDYIVRSHPETGTCEVVAHGPVPKHSIPNSVLDPERLIFYGGTAAGAGKEVRFFAYDVKAGRMLYDGPDGPARCMILAGSTGRLYFVPGSGEGPLMRYDPKTPTAPPVKLAATMDLRATTAETPQGYVYGLSKKGATLYAFNTRTEEVEVLGEAAVGGQTYVTSIDADPTGRFLYFTAGAHGGGEKDGTPIVQYDVRTRTRKVIAFLHPFYKETYGCTLTGSFASAVDPTGDKLYITWNANRSGGKAWDTVALTVVHIPASERE